MYDFIYLYFYNFFLWKKDNDPKDSAIYGIIVAIFFHIFFLYTSFSYFTNINPLALLFGTDHSKFYWLPLVIGVIFLIHRIFKKRSVKILNEKNLSRQVLNLRNTLLVLILVFGPLIIGIAFLD
jgi:hypothetical protein